MSTSPGPRILRTARGTLELGGRTRVMGILNVTPDSFSDAGAYADPAAAVAHAARMVAEGADLIDVGGESTRPGSQSVPAEEQRRRVIPVIEGIRAAGLDVFISIDTRSAQVAEAALEAGADIVNDVSALRRDPEMARICARRGAGVVLMHMQGAPATMQQAPEYGDVVREVRAFLGERAAAATAAGIAREQIIVDPGIGFGKTIEHNLALLRNIPDLLSLGYPLLIGVSRKAFLGAIVHEPDARGRDLASAVLAGLCAACGLHIVRAHNVAATVQAVRVSAAIAESQAG